MKTNSNRKPRVFPKAFGSWLYWTPNRYNDQHLHNLFVEATTGGCGCRSASSFKTATSVTKFLIKKLNLVNTQTDHPATIDDVLPSVERAYSQFREDFHAHYISSSEDYEEHDYHDEFTWSDLEF